MSLSDLASLGSFVSGIAVLASLGFLYFQMRKMTEQVRQAERNQQALLRTETRTRAVEMLLTATDPSIAPAVSKGYAGDEDISAMELAQFTAYMSALFIAFEDVFFQHSDGLITDSAFAAPQAGWRVQFGNPGARQHWKSYRSSFSREFVEYVDGLIAETPVRKSPDALDAWIRGVSEEKARAV